VLMVGGPRLGPAVLFWSALVVVLLVSWALGRIPLTPLRTRHWLLLGLGLSQVPVAAAGVVAGTLLALGWRRSNLRDRRPLVFDLVQLVLVVCVLSSLVVMFVAVEQGLLQAPDMRIAGNGSDGHTLRWFQDRTFDELPRPWVISVPLLAYRAAMLAWALWLALSVIRWSRWAWGCFIDGGLWQPLRKPAPEPAPTAVPPPSGP
jgi:hypothetical protein